MPVAQQYAPPAQQHTLPVNQYPAPVQQYTAAPAQQQATPVQQPWVATQDPTPRPEHYTHPAAMAPQYVAPQASVQQAPTFAPPTVPQIDPNQQTWSPPTQAQQPWAADTAGGAIMATAPQQAQATMPENGIPALNNGQPVQTPASPSEAQPHPAQSTNPPWMK
jgi:hypothetical protein